MYRVATYPEGADQSEVILGNEPSIHPTAVIRDSWLGPWTEIGPRSIIEESSFGDYSYAFGDVSIIYSRIGKFCSLASHVRINPVNHPMWRASQHHFTYRRRQYGFHRVDDHDFFAWRRQAQCNIGHDAWIGHAAIVMPGVQIGIGAVVGSGAVVTKNVSPYEIVVGIPARVIKKRFSDDIIRKLVSTAWWDWDRETMKQRFEDFVDINLFVEKYGRL